MKGRSLYWLCLVWCLWGATAFAGDTKTLLESAKRSYKIGEYEQALKGFQEVYKESGEPAALLNVAQCLRFLGRYEEAVRSYSFYLGEVPKSPYRDDLRQKI